MAKPKTRPLNLFRLLWQPVKTWRRIHKIFKSVELIPYVQVRDLSSDKPGPDDFVVLGQYAVPAIAWPMLRASLVKVDYTYASGKKYWEIKGDQDVAVNIITRDEMTAMYVAKRLKDASK